MDELKMGGASPSPLDSNQLIYFIAETRTDLKNVVKGMDELKVSLGRELKDLKHSVEEMIDRMDADIDGLRVEMKAVSALDKSHGELQAKHDSLGVRVSNIEVLSSALNISVTELKTKHEGIEAKIKEIGAADEARDREIKSLNRWMWKVIGISIGASATISLGIKLLLKV